MAIKCEWMTIKYEWREEEYEIDYYIYAGTTSSAGPDPDEFEIQEIKDSQGQPVSDEIFDEICEEENEIFKRAIEHMEAEKEEAVRDIHGNY